MTVDSTASLLRDISSESSLEKEYAFEMTTSNLRYGPGVTKEVGMDVQNLGIKKLCVFTDKNVSVVLMLNELLDKVCSIPHTTLS